MKKLLVGICALMLVGCAEKGPVYKAGTYSAEATGMEKIKVTVTLDEEAKITDVTIDASGETPEIGQKAVDELKAQILEKSSDAIDGVAGATVTSDAVKAAVKDCIAQAVVE